MVRLAMAGALATTLTACFAGGDDGRPTVGLAEATQAEDGPCHADADCGSAAFCDFSFSDDPDLGGRCTPEPRSPCVGDDQTCHRTVFTGFPTPTPDGSGGSHYCTHCTCNSDGGSFDGDICGSSTDMLIDECAGSC